MQRTTFWHMMRCPWHTLSLPGCTERGNGKAGYPVCFSLPRDGAGMAWAYRMAERHKQARNDRIYRISKIMPLKRRALPRLVMKKKEKKWQKQPLRIWKEKLL